MKEMPVKTKKILGIVIIAVTVLIAGLLCWVIGKPLFECAGDEAKLQAFGEQFRAWVNERGILGRIVFVLLIVVQVVIAIIPGEPFEFAAGYAFGWLEGTILCMIGIVIGSAIIFALVRKFGKPFVNLFFPDKDLDNLKFMKNGERVGIVTFFLMFLPGTPKDLLSYAAGLTPMKFWTWMLIVAVARIPSIITSTISGDALNGNNIVLSIVIYGATLLLSGIGLLIYKAYCKKHQKPAKESEKETPAEEENGNKM